MCVCVYYVKSHFLYILSPQVVTRTSTNCSTLENTAAQSRQAVGVHKTPLGFLVFAPKLGFSLRKTTWHPYTACCHGIKRLQPVDKCQQETFK